MHEDEPVQSVLGHINQQNLDISGGTFILMFLPEIQSIKIQWLGTRTQNQWEVEVLIFDCNI